MNARPYSYSKLSFYEECPGKLKHYLLGDPKHPTEVMQQGALAHAVYEAYANHLCSKNLQTDISAIEGIAEQVYADGNYQMGRVLFDRTMKELILPFVQNHMFDPNLLGGVETRIAIREDLRPCDWNDPECWFRSVLDLLIFDDENVATVTDYKTGFLIEEPGLQADIYAWLVMNQYPHIKMVRVVMDNTRFNIEKTERYDRDDMPDIEDRVRTACARLEADTRLDYAPGLHCLQCQYSRTCGAAFNVPGVIKSDKDAKATIEAISLLERDLANAKEMLRAWVVAHGNVAHNGCEWGFHSSVTRKVHDVAEFIKAAQERGLNPDDYVSINSAKTKTKKFLKVMGDIMDRLTEEETIIRFAGKKMKGGDDE